MMPYRLKRDNHMIHNRLLCRIALCLYAVASGAIFAFAEPPQMTPILAWIGLAPYLGLLGIEGSSRERFWYGWLAGHTAFSLYLWWYFDILPLTWLGVETTTALLVGVVAITLFLTAAYFGVWFGVFLVLVKKVSRGSPLMLLGTAFVLWPVFEYARTFIFSFHPYLFGPGSVFGDHAALVLFSYAAVTEPFIRGLAPFLGNYGVSAIVLLPNLALVFTVRAFFFRRANTQMQSVKGNYAAAVVALFAFFLAVYGGNQLYRQGQDDGEGVKVALVQTDFPTADILPDLEEGETAVLERNALWERSTRQLIERALAADPAIVVMPEGAPSLFDQPPIGAYPTFENITERLGVEKYHLVIDTAFPPRKWDTSANSTTLIDNRSGVIGTYTKRFVMPWGEYVPYLTAWASRLFGFNWKDVVYELRPGRENGVYETGIGKVSVMTCSEILSPMLARRSGRAGGNILIFSSSEAILRGSRKLQAQNLAMGQLTAAMLRTPIIYAANGGRSFVLDRRGDILWQSSGIGEEVAVVEVVPNSEKTIAAYLLP